VSFIYARTIEALTACGCAALPAYQAALQNACQTHPPPFAEQWYGDKYRSIAVDGTWMAASLIANAEKEGEGSRKLWELAGRIDDPHISECVRKHAVDESRHALLYVAICELVFPGAMEGEVRAFAESLSPRFASDGYPSRQAGVSPNIVTDELIQMNIGEIRTMIHQYLMRPVIFAHCPMKAEARLMRTMDVLMNDEVRHIRYTAELIDDAARVDGGRFVNGVFADRLREFNGITLREVGESEFVSV
jgi:hypothetical protein